MRAPFGLWQKRSTRRPFTVLYDASVVILLLLFAASWLYGGNPDEAAQRRQALTRGVDNVLGGVGSGQVLLNYGGIDDTPEINERIQTIFEPIAQVALEHRSDLDYRIAVLKSEVPNAFSLPGGRTYITRGLIEILETDDQIAGVLGHELAHTTESHGTKAFGRDLGLFLAYDLILDHVEDEQRREAAQVAGLSHTLISTGYSRAAETEADELGMAFAIKAGYAPLGLAEALELIEAHQREIAKERGSRNDVPEFFRTHPLTENRVRHIRQVAYDMGYDVYVPGDHVTEALRRTFGQDEAQDEDDENATEAVRGEAGEDE